jgi:ankyrin repeat protein
MIRFLAAQKGVSINATDRFGVTPLMETIRKGHTEASNLLKSIGGAPSVDQRSGFALCNAAANNNMDALQELHLSGVDLGTADYDGRTALHLAASNGNSSVVQWLIKRSDDINVNIVDAMCNTALDDAVRGKHVDIERMIAAVGGKKSKDMFNPLSTTLRNTNNNLAKISSTSTAEGTSLDSV